MPQLAKLPLARPLGVVMAMAALSGCMTAGPGDTGHYSAPTSGSPVIANETPYSDALRCMIGYTAHRPLRVAVGQIADDTGKAGSGGNGYEITQGAALMAMSALAKAGVPMVERFDTSVAGHGWTTSLPRPDYILAGGITELNGASRGSGDAEPGVVTVGLDLRLIDSRTLEVVDVISYRKQLTDGASSNRSVDFAVRWTIERAVFEMMSRLYRKAGDSCSAVAVQASDDPGAADTSPQEDVAASPALNNERPARNDLTRFYTAQSTEPALRRKFDQ